VNDFPGDGADEHPETAEPLEGRSGGSARPEVSPKLVASMAAAFEAARELVGDKYDAQGLVDAQLRGMVAAFEAARELVGDIYDTVGLLGSLTRSLTAAFEAAEAVWADKHRDVVGLLGPQTAAMTKLLGDAADSVFADKQRDVIGLLGPLTAAMTKLLGDAAGSVFADKQRDVIGLLGPVGAGMAAALEAARPSWADRYDGVIGHLDFPLPPSLAPLIEEAGRALAQSESPAVEGAAADEELTDDDAEPSDEFTTAIDAFVALGLAGRNLAVNSTALAWLLTVRQVERAWGRKAARQALATFIAIGVTLFGAAWLVNDANKHTSEAVLTTAAVTLAVLLHVWGKVGGE
jgi:hypothetical protein